MKVEVATTRDSSCCRCPGASCHKDGAQRMGPGHRSKQIPASSYRADRRVRFPGKLPITIHRKHVIDFHRGWHDGLAKLLDTFAEDRVPQVMRTNGRNGFPDRRHASRIDRPETLESNWLPIVSLRRRSRRRVQSAPAKIAQGRRLTVAPV